MREKITLPVCGFEVELAVMDWEESKTFHQRGEEFLAAGGTYEEWMEQALEKHYPKKTVAQAMKAAPDAMALYNDTVRYNKRGPEFIKNSSRSGIGAPTQTAPTTAEDAGKPTPTA